MTSLECSLFIRGLCVFVCVYPCCSDRRAAVSAATMWVRRCTNVFWFVQRFPLHILNRLCVFFLVTYIRLSISFIHFVAPFISSRYWKLRSICQHLVCDFSILIDWIVDEIVCKNSDKNFNRCSEQIHGGNIFIQSVSTTKRRIVAIKLPWFITTPRSCRFIILFYCYSHNFHDVIETFREIVTKTNWTCLKQSSNQQQTTPFKWASIKVLVL